MAELKLGYNPYYYNSLNAVYNGRESYYRIAGTNDQDFFGASWDPSSYAHKSDANIVTGIKVSYRRKYAKDDALAIEGSVRLSFYPYVIQSPSISGNIISGQRGKLSQNTQHTEFNNTSWSGVESRTMATDGATYKLSRFRNNYLTVFCTIKRMSGTLGHRGYIKQLSGTLVYTPRYYARFRNSDGSKIDSITDTIYNSGVVPSPPTLTKDGYTFKGWSRTKGSSSAEPLVAGHDEDIYWYAVYEKITYTITVNSGIGGTVTGGGTFEQGKTVTIKATPDIGYRFVKWAEDGNTNASRTVTVSGNATYTAVFEKITYAITASAGEGGTISPSGSSQVIHGDSQTYTITPNSGYEIESVMVDGVNQGAVSSFTFSNVTAAHTISVTFKYVPTYYLDLNGILDGASSGSISPYGTADVYINGVLTSDDCGDFWTAYPAGTTYEIKDIKANDGYHYDGVYSGTLSGTITARTIVVLSFSTVAKPPEFTSASLTYAGSQVSQNNKVPAGESCILSVVVS